LGKWFAVSLNRNALISRARRSKKGRKSVG